MNEPEQELFSAACMCNGQPGKVVITTRRVIIKTRSMTGETQQSIPRSEVAGSVDCKMGLLMAEVLFHRQGGQSITLKSIKKTNAQQIESLLNGLQ